MDKNKAKKLSEIGYKVLSCCGRCIYSNISPDGWGTCNKFTYKHLKHTGKERQLSIHQYGVCSFFKEDKTKNISLFFPVEIT